MAHFIHIPQEVVVLAFLLDVHLFELRKLLHVAIHAVEFSMELLNLLAKVFVELAVLYDFFVKKRDLLI